jgi:hypothetical protein
MKRIRRREAVGGGCPQPLLCRLATGVSPLRFHIVKLRARTRAMCRLDGERRRYLLLQHRQLAAVITSDSPPVTGAALVEITVPTHDNKAPPQLIPRFNRSA